MKRPPTKQKSFKSYLEALNSSLKNAVAACRAEDAGPGVVAVGQKQILGVVRGAGSTGRAALRVLGSGKSGLGKGCHPSELSLSGLRSWTRLSKQAHCPHYFNPSK